MPGQPPPAALASWSPAAAALVDMALPEMVAALAGGPVINELEAHVRAARLELHQTVTREDLSWRGRRGRVGRAEFEAVMHAPADTLCFVCGPPAMVEEAVLTLRALGVPTPAIRTERWGI